MQYSPTTAAIHGEVLILTYDNGATTGLISNRAITGTGATPALLTLSSSNPHNFGTQTLGTNTDVTFTVTNTGGVSATAISETTLAAPFTFAGVGTFPGGGTCTATLAGGNSTCTIIVRYTPATAATHNGTATLSYNNGAAAGQTVARTLTGVGQTPATLTISNTNYDFGNKAVTSVNSFSFTITNTGSTTATAVTPTIGGAPFSIVGGTCGATLAAAATCTVTVQYAPTTVANHPNTLMITYNNGVAAGQTATNNIQGTGISAAVITISNSGYDFGSKATGSSTNFTFTVTNTGTNSATGITYTGLAAPFSFPGGGTCGATLAGGNTTCTLIVNFSPTLSGLQTDTLDITYNNGATAGNVTSNNIQGTGAGPAVLTISDAGYNFGTKANGSTNSKVFTITNSGSTMAIGIGGSGLAAPYTFAAGGTFPGGGTCGATLAGSGTTCTFIIEYSPTVSGASSDTIDISYNDGSGSQTAQRLVVGTGAAPALLSISDTNYNYGPHALNSSTNYTFTVSNTGGVVATGITGSGLAAPFVFAGGSNSYPGGGTCGATINAGANCTIIVVYTPTTVAVHSDTIDLTYNNGALAGQVASNTIQGNGISAANITISNAGYNFGTKATTSVNNFTFTISNTGSEQATALSYGGIAAPYTYPGGGTCGATLNAGATCTLFVRWSPVGTGVQNTTIDISYNNGASVTNSTNAITGTGANPALLAITGAPAVYDFGSKSIASSTTVSLTIANTGGVPATNLAGSGLAAPFDFSGSGFPGSGNCTTTLNAGASCTFDARYIPSAVGLLSDTIDITYDNGATTGLIASRNIQGTGVTPAVLTISNQPTYNYGNVPVGASVDYIFTITKTGSSNATSVVPTLTGDLTWKGGAYPGTGGDCGDPITTTCNVTVRFTPTALGVRNGSVSIAYNDGTSAQSTSTATTGVGTAPATLTISDSNPFDYGMVLNGYNRDYTFTVTNTGSVTASVMSGSGLAAPYNWATGTYPGGGSCGATLASSATCTVVVRFQPTATNTFAGTLTMNYNNGVVGGQTVSRTTTGKGYVPAMTIALQTPATSPNNNSTPVLRVSGLTSGIGVELHSNGTCTALKGSGTSSGATLDITSSALADATWNFYTKVTDTYGNGFCGAATVTYALDTTPPLSPSGWALTSPNNGVTSNDNTPIINGTGIAGEDGSTAKLYSDPSCSTNIDNAVISAGSFSLTALSYATNGTVDGVKQYFGRIVDPYGNQSGCTNLVLSYTYDSTAPNPATGMTVTSAWTKITDGATVTPAFSWTASTSPDLNKYEVGLHNAVGGGNSNGGWTNLGTSVSTTMTGLGALTQCTNYYPTVRAIDNAGNISTYAVGTPFKYDGTAPTQPGIISLGTDPTKSQSATATWTASTDTCSLLRQDIALGTSAGGTEVVGWTSIGSAITTYQFTGLSLTRGTSYFISVRGVDSAGNIGSVRTSAAFVPPLPTLLGAWEEMNNGTAPSHDNNLGGGGTNRLLVATIMTKDNASNDILTMTWGGVAMTQAAEVESNDGTNYWRTETWYMKEASIATVSALATRPFVYTTSNGAVTTADFVSVIYQRINQTTSINATGTGIRQPVGLTVSASAAANKDNMNLACSIMSIQNAGYTLSSAGWGIQTLSNSGGGTARTKICGNKTSIAVGTETATATSPANALMSMTIISINAEP